MVIERLPFCNSACRAEWPQSAWCVSWYILAGRVGVRPAMLTPRTDVDIHGASRDMVAGRGTARIAPTDRPPHDRRVAWGAADVCMRFPIRTKLPATPPLRRFATGSGAAKGVLTIPDKSRAVRV
jgi:hypothetical protein